MQVLRTGDQVEPSQHACPVWPFSGESCLSLVKRLFFAMKDQRSLSVVISGLTTWMRMSLFSRSSHVVFGRPLLSCCRHLHTTSGCDIVINLCIGCLHLLAIVFFLLFFYTTTYANV